MSSAGDRIMARIAASLDDDALIAAFSPDGLARQAQWHAEDDWLIEYTTERIRGGRLDGMFAVLVFKPIGRGSRAGRKGAASRWERTKLERCKTRREARSRAEEHYYAHSPKLAAKHGRA